MKLTPRATALRRTRTASFLSLGSPQTPLPVIRIAPNPSRLTLRSPPIRNWPAFAAGSSFHLSIADVLSIGRFLSIQVLDSRARDDGTVFFLRRRTFGAKSFLGNPSLE